MSKPAWEQLDNEPTEAYVRFLLYRNLGPSRSLDEAYKLVLSNSPKPVTNRNKSLQATGTWASDSARYGWVERANQWDVDMLSSMGKEVMQNLCTLFNKLALKLISWIDDDKIAPKDIDGYLRMLNDVSTLFGPSTIAAFGQLSTSTDYTQATASVTELPSPDSSE